MEQYFAAVLVLGITAQWLAWRMRLPSILLLLTFGAVLGEYMAWQHGTREPVPADLLFPFVSLAVGVILFEGGMSLQLQELKESGAAVLGLVTIGAIITWVLAATCVWWTMGLDGRVAAVIGGILIVTGPTVVGPLLRLIRPSRRIAATVKWEGIIIDPVGAALALLAFEALHFHGEGLIQASLFAIGETVLIGVVIGLAGAGTMVLLMKRFMIPDFLDSPAFLAAAVLVFTVSNALQTESGLLTVTVMGIALTNQKLAPVKHVMQFKENLQVLLIACLFIVLGSRVDLRSVIQLGWPVVGLVALLILVVRPFSVWISTIGTKLDLRERIFLAFLAPRGIVAAAVASVFALEATHLDVPEAAKRSLELMVPVVFVCIASTVAFYGLFSPILARWLGLSEASPQGLLLAGADDWVRELAQTLEQSDVQVTLIDTNYSNIATARMDGLDAHCASILAEYVHEEIDMAGIGRLLALTPNDEVNTLAASEFAHLFGRRNIYQLPPRNPNAGHRRQQIAEHLRGRLLFDESMNFDEFARRVDRGAQIKVTQITEEFPYEAFVKQYGDQAQPLVILLSSGLTHVVSIDEPKEPAPGDSIVFLLQTPGQTAAENARQAAADADTTDPAAKP